MKLTSNQMIQLLATYRGTREQELHTGTWISDCDRLIRVGLLRDTGIEIKLTQDGHDRMQRALDDEQRAPAQRSIPEPHRTWLKGLSQQIKEATTAGNYAAATKAVLEAMNGPKGELLRFYTLECDLFIKDFDALCKEP